MQIGSSQFLEHSLPAVAVNIKIWKGHTLLDALLDALLMLKLSMLGRILSWLLHFIPTMTVCRGFLDTPVDSDLTEPAPLEGKP